MLGAVKEHVSNLDNCLENYTDAVTVLCSPLTEETGNHMYQNHMLVWSEHCKDLKDRAREVISVLETAQQQVLKNTSPVSSSADTNLGTGAISNSNPVNTTVPDVSNSTCTGSEASPLATINLASGPSSGSLSGQGSTLHGPLNTAHSLVSLSQLLQPYTGTNFQLSQ